MKDVRACRSTIYQVRWEIPYILFAAYSGSWKEGEEHHITENNHNSDRTQSIVNVKIIR